MNPAVVSGWVGEAGGEMLTEVKNELSDLANGDVLLPPDADATRALEVVPVHDNVNSQVQRDDGP